MAFIALLAPLFTCISCIDRLGLLLDPRRDDSAIHAMGDRLVVDIEKWRSSHGHYPSSLAEAGLNSPTDYKGGFQYEGNSKGFILSIGVADGRNVRHTYYLGNIADKYVVTPGWNCAD